jgi:Peptidase family M1 domain/Peptidase M1 N-terminal domain
VRLHEPFGGASRRLSRLLSLSILVGVLFATMVAAASGHHGPTQFEPGAPGAGDPYFPLDGNGGYDVRHYDLDVRYDPATDVLTGVATIRARATQNLSSFNLDLDGLTVRSIEVNHHRATWTRDGGELTVSPSRGLRDDRRFTTEIRYDGIPETIFDQFGVSGFFHTDDGTLVVGEPAVAATWFPVNDHPSDKAAYTFHITAPAGLEAVANGILEGKRTKRGWTTWTWEAEEPMASYLATANIGEFDLRSYRNAGIRYWDAIDPDLFAPTGTPRTGLQFAISQDGEPSYKRLARTITVPAAGATVSFWIARDTEPNWDFVFVEAHTVGQSDWTTLPDQNGHTKNDTGLSCPGWLGLHPFLAHYQTDNGDGTCSPQSGDAEWWAASGKSNGYELWSVDLSAYAGSTVELSISYANDEVFQGAGAFVDDIVVSTGAGGTSFEDDGDTFDGWTVPGAPADSPANPNDWIAGTVAETPAPLGVAVDASFARQGEIIDFLSGVFGSYPFSAAGGIVDDFGGLAFALENQTRPIYSKFFFSDPGGGDSVVVHELAHQWYGDSLAVAAWQHIWLNEGFATYAEWLWSEREGLGTAQEIFDFFYGLIPADDPFWAVTIGDPGPANLFHFAVYARGAMTLHQLRLAVGDGDFFQILRRWASSQAGGNVTTAQFIRLAERISGQDLDALFDTWLFTAEKPVLTPALGLTAAAPRSTSRLRVPPAAQRLLRRDAKSGLRR